MSKVFSFYIHNLLSIWGFDAFACQTESNVFSSIGMVSTNGPPITRKSAIKTMATFLDSGQPGLNNDEFIGSTTSFSDLLVDILTIPSPQIWGV